VVAEGIAQTHCLVAAVAVAAAAVVVEGIAQTHCLVAAVAVAAVAAAVVAEGTAQILVAVVVAVGEQGLAVVAAEAGLESQPQKRSPNRLYQTTREQAELWRLS